MLFRRALSSAPDAPPVDVAQAVPDWLMQRSERQGLMWPRSRDPAVGPDELVPHIAATCIAVGGRTHAGFHAIAERLCRQIPSAVVDLYPERSHFDPPHVAEAACFAEPVLEMWGKRSAVI